jgi:serine protease Do
MVKVFSIIVLAGSLLICNDGFSQQTDTSNGKSQEIIIRKQGGKETTINIQIDDDNVMINGKPLMEFNEDGVTIMKRKMRVHDGKPGMHHRRRFHMDGMDQDPMNRSVEETIDSTTFLGVTTEYAKKGAEIVMVSQGSAADKAGLLKGDIITQIDNEKISSPEDLSTVIRAKNPKQKVEITFIRDGKQKKIEAELQLKKRVTRKTIVIAERNIQGMPFPHSDRPLPPLPPYVGNEGEIIMENIIGDDMNLNNMDVQVQVSKKPKIGLKIKDINEGNGVEVLEVVENSAAATAGILEEDIITGINGKSVNNTDEAREQLKAAEQSSSFNVDLLRKGKKMSVKIMTPKKLKTADL